MANVWNILETAIVKNPLFTSYGYSSLYPSEASYVDSSGEVQGGCLRKSFLRFKTQMSKEDADRLASYTKPFDATSNLIFAEGNSVEDTIVRLAKEAGIWYANSCRFKVVVQPGYCISGEVDAVFKVDGQLVGVEVKSISGYFGEKEVIKANKPKADHLLQTALYAWMSRDTIPSFKLMYYLRGAAKRTEFTVTVQRIGEGPEDFVVQLDGVDTDITIKAIVDRYRTVVEHIESNTLPPRDFDLVYDDQKMDELQLNGLMADGISESWDKYKQSVQQFEEGNRKQPLKRPHQGSWRCSYCQFKDYCYDKDETARKG